MKKIYSVLLVICILIFSGCQKSTTNSGGTMKFTLNGVNYSYPVPNKMTRVNLQGYPACVADGQDPNTNSQAYLTLDIGGQTSGTYPFSSSGAPTTIACKLSNGRFIVAALLAAIPQAASY